MARPFTWPEVTKLEVGQSCVLTAPQGNVKRKTDKYGARNGKRFAYAGGCNDAGIRVGTAVTRLPDPEPSAA